MNNSNHIPDMQALRMNHPMNTRPMKNNTIRNIRNIRIPQLLSSHINSRQSRSLCNSHRGSRDGNSRRSLISDVGDHRACYRGKRYRRGKRIRRYPAHLEAFQANGTHCSGGAGLGLALVKELVETMNVTIIVVSRLGEGSCFTLRFPRAGGSMVAGSPEREQEYPVSGQGKTDALKHTLPG